MRKLFFIISIFVLFNVTLFSQSAHDSLSFRVSNFTNNTLSSSFEKQLNIYNLNSRLKYGINFDKFFIGIHENFNSTLVKGRTNNIKDEQYFSVLGEYNASKLLRLGILLNSNVYSDDRKLGINKNELLNTSFYLKLYPHDLISITPYIGISENNQITEEDKGLIYGSEASVDNLSVNEFLFNSSLKFQNEEISPRKNTLRSYNLNIANMLDKSLGNTIRAEYEEFRKDFYFEADSATATAFEIKNNIQSRTETRYSIFDRLSFVPENSPLSFDIMGRVSWRDIDRNTRYRLVKGNISQTFDTQINEFNINLESSVGYRSKVFNGFLRFIFAEREENHNAKNYDGSNPIQFNTRNDLEKIKNNKGIQATLSLVGNLRLSLKDLLSFSLFHRKLRYDTPSKENYDDRDELLSMLELNYSRRISPFFTFFAGIEGGINQIVYIFAERSANNNIRRNLKFSSGGDYIGKYFSSRNTAEVSASYTVYDFEDINPNYKSFSFRQYSVKDSSKLFLTRNVSFQFNGYLKYSEQGDFKWNNFSGKPVRFLEEYYGEPMVKYIFRKRAGFGIGIRYFSLLTFNYDENNKKKKANEYTSIGPISEITYNLNNNLSLKINGWYEKINTENKKNKNLTNLFFTINWQI